MAERGMARSAMVSAHVYCDARTWPDAPAVRIAAEFLRTYTQPLVGLSSMAALSS